MSVNLSTSALAGETQLYTYDALGRIVQVAHSGTVNSTLKASYCYDPASNRTNYQSSSTGAAAPCVTAGVAAAMAPATTVTDTGAATTSSDASATQSDSSTLMPDAGLSADVAALGEPVPSADQPVTATTVNSAPDG